MTARVKAGRAEPLLVIGASQRFDNAALTNDGAGTYFANFGNDASSSPVAGYAKWNFNFHVGGPNTQSYYYRLFYDFNPAAAGTQPSFGVIDLLTLPQGGVAQNSWNLGMGFLTSGAPGVTPPPGVFNALMTGTYSFALVAYTQTGRRNMPFGDEVGRVAMNVNVVPEPASIVLMATGLIGTGIVVRRRRTTAAARV